MFDRSDTQTRPYPILAPEPTKVAIQLPEVTHFYEIPTVEDQPALVDSSLSVSLPICAERAYRLFSDSEAIPEWMGVVRSSRIISRTEDGRARRTAFIARLERASMGYTLEYTYDDDNMQLRWKTSAQASTVIDGSARFQPLGPRACMMHYELDLHTQASMPAWGDEMYNGHPASAVLSDFRDYVSRTKPGL